MSKNLLSEEQFNISNWVKGGTGGNTWTCNNIYTADTKENDVSQYGTNDWERLYLSCPVEPNKVYTFRFKFWLKKGNRAYSHGSWGGCIMAPNAPMGEGNPLRTKPTCLATTELFPQNPTDGFIEYSCIFTNTQGYDSVYVAFDFGDALDGSWTNYCIKDLAFENTALLVPIMTGDDYTDADGRVWKASASTVYAANYPAYKAFDGNANTCWACGNASGANSHNGRECPTWVQIEMPEAVMIDGYILQGMRAPDRTNSPTKWQLLGSNDGTEFVEIDSRDTTVLSDTQVHSFDVKSKAAYKIYRLCVTMFEYYNDTATFNLYKMYSNVKYIVESGGVYYRMQGGEVTEIAVTELTADIFQTNGADEPPSSEILLTLTNPKVLAWSEEEQPQLTATVKATPYPQNLFSPVYDMTDPSILGIEKVIAEASEDVTFAVSFDSGATWKHYTGTEWATLSEDTSGMSAETIMAIPTDKWAEVATTGTFQVRVTLPSVESTLSNFIVDYLNA